MRSQTPACFFKGLEYRDPLTSHCGELCVESYMTHRPLTHDEQKAAEAAFRGGPFDPNWSAAARAVYDGIVKALPAGHAGDSLAPGGAGATEAVSVASDSAKTATEAHLESESAAEAVGSVPGTPVTSRQEAVEKGLLIDVSSSATDLGFTIPIGISKPLWESGITVAGQFSASDVNQRVRDVLMALRLSLGGSRDLPSVMQFPALLVFPPEESPRLCSMIAVAHKDAEAPFALTLLHPSEVHQIYPFLN